MVQVMSPSFVSAPPAHQQMCESPAITAMFDNPAVRLSLKAACVFLMDDCFEFLEWGGSKTFINLILIIWNLYCMQYHIQTYVIIHKSMALLNKVDRPKCETHRPQSLQKARHLGRVKQMTCSAFIL